MKKIAALFFLAACSQPQSRWPEHLVDYDTAPLWRAQWVDDAAQLDPLLEEARWQQSSSIEGERYWQNHQLSLGRRAVLQIEAQSRAATEPDNPDFQYLQARLLQDPVALQIQFEVLAHQWPTHAWIRLGAAGSNQNLGNWQRARFHLGAAPDWPDARQFRQFLFAQQAQAEGQDEPWAGLLESAFEGGSLSALQECRRLAGRANNLKLVRRTLAELEMRQTVAADLSTEARLEILLERGLAELGSAPPEGLAELIQKMDDWSGLLDLPQLWSDARRYKLALGAGQLLAPESYRGAWAEFVAEQQRMVMVGSSLGTRPHMLVLEGVERHTIHWPGRELPIEIAVCQSGRSSGKELISGGAIFRGFYVRRDLSTRLAASLEAAAQRLTAQALLEFDKQEILAAKFGPPGSLPEDMDLALRLRAGILQKQETSAEAWEWRALYLHEAGHLPDVLPWTEGHGPVLQALTWALTSWLRDGMVLGEWEYRAQLRALASGQATVWNLAHIVETAHRPDYPYYQPYRRLLTDLVARARALDLPELPHWHRLTPLEITQLAHSLCQESAIELLPQSVVSELVEQLDIAK